MGVTWSDLLFRTVMSKSVLTFSEEYFSLRKPLERRAIELAGKHWGRQPGWVVPLELLVSKSGSASPLRLSSVPARLRSILQNATATIICQPDIFSHLDGLHLGTLRVLLFALET